MLTFRALPAFGRSVFLVLSIVAGAARADDSPESHTVITVTATRTPTPADEVGSSVTVIDRRDIERNQQRTAADALRAVPGVNLVQTGGPGGRSTVFMRGANANHTKVLIDGIDVGDPSDGGTFDFAHLQTADIERVEVLRGPQSGLYGSDAIGGVINVVTRRGVGPARAALQAEGGSFGTFNQTASLSGARKAVDYAFTVAHLRSDDTPVTPTELLPPGQRRIGDSYDNTTVSTKLGAKASDSFDLGLVARYVDTTLRFTGDDFSVFPAVPAARQSESNTRQLFTRATGHLVSFGGGVEQTVGLGYTDYRRRDLSLDSDPTYNRGDRVKLDWLGHAKITAGHVVSLGAEHQIDEIRDSPVSAQTTNEAAFVQLQSDFGGGLYNTVSVRRDANDRFGAVDTYRLAPAFHVADTGTTLKASIGSGFKAPTLTQLFVDFPSFGFSANPNLKPEKSVGTDAGFEQTAFADRVSFGSTYFHNDIDNLITVNAAGTTYQNIAKARTYGAESFVAWTPAPTLALRADHTYTLAQDATLHQELLRRPKHKASLGASWQADEAMTLSATVLYVGSRIDGNRDFSVPRLKSGDTTLVNLAASYDLGGGVAAFARVDNLFDRRYQDPVGFARPGLGVFAGLRVAFTVEGK